MVVWGYKEYKARRIVIDKAKYKTLKVMKLYYMIQQDMVNLEKSYKKANYNLLDKKLNDMLDKYRKAITLMESIQGYLTKAGVLTNDNTNIRHIIIEPYMLLITISIAIATMQAYINTNEITKIEELLSKIKTYNESLKNSVKEFQEFMEGLQTHDL